MSERLAYTVTETASALGIGRTVAYDLIRRGEIPHVRIGRSIRIPRASLDSWLTARTQPTTPTK
jgi:excisionase family DNA binding protein